MNSIQISEWEAYDRIEPIGEWRQDYRIASLQAHIVNVINALYAKEGETPDWVDPIEYMPDHSGDLKPLKEKMRQEKLKRGLMRMVNSLGGDSRESSLPERGKTKDKGASTL